MSLLLLAAAYYVVAGLAINVGYHRGLAHRSFNMKPWLEHTLVTLGLPAGTPIQWAGNHRFHHARADQPDDPHSPVQSGFWHAHVGWYIGTRDPLLCFLYSVGGPARTVFDGWHRPRTNQEHNHLAPDVAADPYYRWLSRPGPYLAGCWLHAAALLSVGWLLGGVLGVCVAWALSALVYNVGDAIDSVAHLVGWRPVRASHFARNHAWLGCLALGEGWHANHHSFPDSARHGLLPGQRDWTWGALLILRRLGLVDGLRVPDEETVRRRLEARG